MTIDREIAESFQPEVKELERLLDMAVEALEFYASYETYVLPSEGMDAIYSEIRKDQGDIAVRALATIEKARNE